MRDGINGGRIPKRWVLLDSQSTADAYSNPDLLTDIHEVKGSLTIHTRLESPSQNCVELYLGMAKFGIAPQALQTSSPLPTRQRLGRSSSTALTETNLR